VGSDFVRIDEAAKILGKTRRTVTNYLEKGVLRRVKEGKPVLLSRTEVEELAVDLGSNFPRMSRKTFYQLVAHVQKLEQDMAVMKKALGYGGSPLRPSRQETLELSAAAMRAVEAKTWSSQEIEMWADLYERMDDVFFDVLASHMPDGTWKTFYDLCVAQMKQVSYDPAFDRRLDLQTLHQRLGFGLKNIRKTILTTIEVGHGKTTETTLDVMDGKRSAVLRHLAAKAG
jgi:excisionase family DNA binding protein